MHLGFNDSSIAKSELFRFEREFPEQIVHFRSETAKDFPVLFSFELCRSQICLYRERGSWKQSLSCILRHFHCVVTHENCTSRSDVEMLNGLLSRSGSVSANMA